MEKTLIHLKSQIEMAAKNAARYSMEDIKRQGFIYTLESCIEPQVMRFFESLQSSAPNRVKTKHEHALVSLSFVMRQWNQKANIFQKVVSLYLFMKQTSQSTINLLNGIGNTVTSRSLRFQVKEALAAHLYCDFFYK